MGQTESVLGKQSGALDLPDAACTSPDRSTVTWKEAKGAGKGWVESAGLRCIEAPPMCLQLEGTLEHQSAVLGRYRLVEGKLVNGRCAWSKEGGADQWIAFDGDSWNVQSESKLGQKTGFADLLCASASPDRSTVTWRVSAGAGKGWVQAAGLRCIEAPTACIRLLGSLPEKQKACLGRYDLVEGKLVNGKAVWRMHADVDATRPTQGQKVIVSNSDHRRGQVGTIVEDDHTSQPFKVQFDDDETHWYREGEVSKQERVAPPDKWIAYDGSGGWRVQPETDLGKTTCFMSVLPESTCASPDRSSAVWKAHDGEKWVDATGLRCTETDAVVTHPSHPHPLCDVLCLPHPRTMRKMSAKGPSAHHCDVCRGGGVRYRCAAGCDHDVCASCMAKVGQV